MKNKLELLWSDGTTSPSVGIFKSISSYFIGIRFHFAALYNTVWGGK